MFRKLMLGVALLALPVTGVAAQQKTLDQVLKCHYDAIGGLQAWEQLTSMVSYGTMSTNGMEIPFTSYQKRPHMERAEFTVQGMTGIQAFDGKTAWMVAPFAGSTAPQKVPENQAKQMKEGADISGPLVNYKKKGITLKLMGTEDVQGTQAYKLEVTLPDSTVQYYDLDTDYCLPIRVSGKREQGSQTYDYETTIGDYKQIAGLTIPYSVQTKVKGVPQAQQSLTVDSVKLNVPLADSLFVMPDTSTTRE